jgi:ribosomal-protein-alanine N-acetyltransferase
MIQMPFAEAIQSRITERESPMYSSNPTPADNIRTAYTLVLMTEAHAIAVSQWRYPPPYDAYNPEPWECVSAEGRELADAEIRSRQYRSVLLGDELYGYVQWFLLASEQGPSVVRLGLGKRPDACSRGRGADFVAFIARETSRRYPGWMLDLEVASGNVRAIRAYERAGFRIADAYELPHPRHGTSWTYNMIWTPAPHFTNL